MTFAEDFERAAESEPIEHAVIGEMGWGDYGKDDRHQPGWDRKGEVLTWAEARPLLDYDYNPGYGAPDCHAVYAYTASWVLYVVQYDGSTSVCSLPRNPTAGEVEMPGG